MTKAEQNKINKFLKTLLVSGYFVKNEALPNKARYGKTGRYGSTSMVPTFKIIKAWKKFRASIEGKSNG